MIVSVSVRVRVIVSVGVRVSELSRVEWSGVEFELVRRRQDEERHKRKGEEEAEATAEAKAKEEELGCSVKARTPHKDVGNHIGLLWGSTGSTYLQANCVLETGHRIRQVGLKNELSLSLYVYTNHETNLVLSYSEV